MEIKALIKVVLTCCSCGYDAAPPYVEVETDNWKDCENIVMWNFSGWMKIENSKGFITYQCPTCQEDTK